MTNVRSTQPDTFTRDFEAIRGTWDFLTSGDSDTVAGYQYDVTNIGVSMLSCLAGAGDEILVAGKGWASATVLSAQGTSYTLRSMGSNAWIRT
ncbi:hypothetical protein HN371_00490 [Candidatus Poribacteria bacterium]|jgi:hypothetical protein|nr:hypothetical protein [Candidatus Poribacteria bacterium]MBT7101169.1 hypothetical protein [Candidatus Poribacteria bacterium]